MRIAVFPGSFDPVTIGHQDIIARASKLFDRVYVSIVPNGTKTHPMFTDEQKLALMRASVEEFPNVEAELGGGLLTDYALRKNAQFLVRGVRNSVDFDAEQQLSLIYRDVSDGALETVLLVAEPKYQHISSTMVRERRAGKGAEVPLRLPRADRPALQGGQSQAREPAYEPRLPLGRAGHRAGGRSGAGVRHHLVA